MTLMKNMQKYDNAQFWYSVKKTDKLTEDKVWKGDLGLRIEKMENKKHSSKFGDSWKKVNFKSLLD